MAWKKSPPELVAAFATSLPDDPLVERRSMFGYPCAFVQGNMVTGLHEERLIVRLPERVRAELVALGGVIFSPMPGRLMKEYVVVPPAIVAKPEQLGAWIARAIAYGTTLPPKVARAARDPNAPRVARARPRKA
jgi:TfoX/Sxy family transcriptional regulator of competence genes